MDGRDGSLSTAAFASAALLVVLCAMTLATGVSQQWFEWAHAPDAYAARLVHDATWLRAIVAVDDAFIAAYVTATVLLATALARGRFGAMHVLVVAGGVAGGVLDLEENHHILAMLRLAERGVALPLGDVLHRSDLSQLKWMIAHVAFVLVGVAIPASGAAARALRVSLVAWQLPVGALYWVVDAPSWQPALTWARYASLVVGFAAIGWISRVRADGVAVGSSARA